jgi:Short C-terminal domain
VFGQDWDKAEATIVARDAKFTGDGSTATYTYVADVRLSSGETFRATIHEPTIATDFWAPSIGDVVSVLVKPKDRKVKFDKDDDRLSVKAFQAAKKQAFEDAQNQPVGTPTTPAVWTSSTEIPDAIASKLAQLGITPGVPMQVFTGDSAEGQAALAALTHAGTPVVQTPETRLTQLKGLHDRGVLTAEEYAEQRHRILDEL